MTPDDLRAAQDDLGAAWDHLEASVRDLSISKQIAMTEAWRLVEEAMAGAPKGLKDLGIILPTVTESAADKRRNPITVVTHINLDSESIAKRVSKHLRRHLPK